MKVNKSIFLVFATNTSTTCNINIPFQVSKISCKAIAYSAATPPAVGTYAFVVSDLTKNQPIGMIQQDNTTPISTHQDVSVEFMTPQTINGTYTFNLVSLAGTALAATGADALGMLLEFSSAENNI